MTAAWDALVEVTRPVADLGAIVGLLEWDQQVMMPPAGSAARARQLSLIARLRHERLVDLQVGDRLAAAESDPTLDPDRKGALRALRRERDRALATPARLVEALSAAQSEGFHAWIRAKSEDDPTILQPALERLIALERERAAAIDATRHPYDVLLEGFDPGTTLAQLRPMFARLAEGLQPLLAAGAAHPSASLPAGPYDLAAQERLHRDVLTAMGFLGDNGRLDASEHPFTIGLGAGDVRITTHLHADDLLSGLGGTLHEAGHGLYEQGIPRAGNEGTFLDEAAGLGLHESQSRFWENHVGRSRPFLQWLTPRLNTALGTKLSADTLYAASNPIQPGLIRIHADEVTYNLHIILRFELEVAMVEGDLSVADLPGAWREAMRRHLGIVPPTDREGCLQDVHWGSGAIGYFPSYTLGNLFAASLWAGLRDATPELDDQLARGDFAPTRAWLGTHVHAVGHARPAHEIVRAAVGDRDGVADLLDHLYARHGALVGLDRPAA